MIPQMLFEDAQCLGNVLFNSLFGNVELLADLFIGEALAAHHKNFVAFGRKQMKPLFVPVLQVGSEGRLVGELGSPAAMDLPLSVMVLAGVFFPVESYY